VKQLRKGIVPVIAFLVLAVNTTSQQALRDNMWVALLGAALIVLAGLLCVGKRWMYFIFPLGVSILVLFEFHPW